jgi:hypothetical protein
MDLVDGGFAEAREVGGFREDRGTAHASQAPIAARERISLRHELAGNLSRGFDGMFESKTIVGQIGIVPNLSDPIAMRLAVTFSSREMQRHLRFPLNHAHCHRGLCRD